MNNSEVRINGVLNAVEKNLDVVRNMTDEQIKELETALKEKTKTVQERINLVNLLSGREISKNAYSVLIEQNMDEFKESVEDGYTFTNRMIPVINHKGQSDTRIVWSSPEASIVRQVTKEIVSEDEYFQVERKLNKYEMRRTHGTIKRDSLNNLKKAIRMVKMEKLENFHEERKTININIAELGKKLLKGSEVQKVNPEIRV